MYPRLLPIPTREGYAASPGVEFKRYQMEDGQYSTIRQFASTPFNYTLNWRLTFAQADLFEAWLEYEAGRGAAFTEIPFLGKVRKVRPITGTPVFKTTGGGWDVSMDVEEIIAAPSIPPRTGKLPIWPNALPELESAGFSLSKVGAVTRTDITSGLAETRVRFRDRLTQYTGTLKLNLSQRDLFWDFYHNDLIDGYAHFMAPFANARSQSKIKARFFDLPSESPLGAWFTVSVSLETTKAPIMSHAQYIQMVGS